MPLHVAKVRSGNKGPGGAVDERARKPGSTAGEGRHRNKPLVPEVGPGGTDCAVELLAQEAETSLILMRARATKVTPRAVASDQSVVARIIPPERLPCAWAGPRATTRVMRSTAEEDSREGVKERVQNGSTGKSGSGPET